MGLLDRSIIGRIVGATRGDTVGPLDETIVVGIVGDAVGNTICSAVGHLPGTILGVIVGAAMEDIIG